MGTQQTSGRALVHGRVVAHVTVQETTSASMTRFAVPGSQTYGHRANVQRGPTTITFDEVFDEQFRKSLEHLAAVWDDVEAKRRLRDQRKARLPFDLALDDDRQIADAAVTWPAVGLGPIETLEFALLSAFS